MTLAANAVLLNFFLVAGFFLDGMAAAAEQIIGRSIGARYSPPSGAVQSLPSSGGW